MIIKCLSVGQFTSSDCHRLHTDINSINTCEPLKIIERKVEVSNIIH